MQSYIVRVYRRSPDNMGDVAGIIENVGTQEKCAFQDIADLHESIEHFIKLGDSECSSYSIAKQIDMYGYDRSSLDDKTV